MSTDLIPLGDAAFIVRVGDSLGEVLATVRKLEAAKIPGVIEITPAFASAGVFLASPAEFETCAAAVRAALRGRTNRGGAAAQKIVGQALPPATVPDKASGSACPTTRRLIEVPVCYDAEFALDLEAVAQHCKLSPNEIVARHAATLYRVRCVGFTPGFPFLAGLPRELATPRRQTPRTDVPAGSIAIGGVQAGVYPLRSPGGWNIIGRTPLRLFDVSREPAALLRSGDRVRFRAITREEFEQWEK